MADQGAIPEARPPCPACGYLADPTTGAVNFCPKCGQDLRPGASERSSASLLGLLVADRYKLIAHLGEGGMGAVYKAEHVRMGKALAVKILRGDFARDPSAVERFRAEARIVSRLSHPHTIAVFDFGEIEALGGFYLAMEYVPGRDLAQVLREQGRFDEARAADIGQQVLGSLAEAHEAGIVHRDMKPGNVMVMQARPGEDFAKVLDFGIAKLRDEVSPSQTSAGAIVGTPNYLAPEQARGEQVDARADLYAVGCLLYELVAGRAPFAGRAPMAVVTAHLHEEPPPLARVAPGVSHRYAALVHRALAKRPADRFASADEMREAILALGEPTASRALQPGPQVTGELSIARREDFAEFERQVRALRRGRVAAPLALLVALVAAAALAWRWGDVYVALASRAPELAARLPAALRPSDRFDGEEHEPNNTAATANRLPIPPGPSGELAGGVAEIHGTIGARLDAATGDADVFRMEIPPLPSPKVLVAEWHAEGSLDGIRGLDVVLGLYRERPGEAGHASAPLVASADRGGPGRPERLEVGVEPGTYYLSVREKHGEATGPIEKPTDRYVLQVRLVDPHPGEEVEPNDAPETGGPLRYPDWRAVAERNGLAEAAPLTGELAGTDADTFALPPAAAGRAPGFVLVAAEGALALRAALWVPDAQDLAPGAGERVRFEPAGEAAPGELLVVPLAPAPGGAPALLRLTAAAGGGKYVAVVLAAGPASSADALARVQALAAADRLPAALQLAAAVARHLPRSAGRADVLLAAGKLAEAAQTRLTLADLPRLARADALLGAAVFEAEGEAARYRAAFEARVEGKGPVAEEAALRVVRLAAPCTPAAVADRVEAFVARFPASRQLPEVRLWRARALEAALFDAGWADAALRRQATAAWEKVGRGPSAAEAQAALARLKARAPPAGPPRPVCPDPGAP